jgi:hypothetical protein
MKLFLTLCAGVVALAVGPLVGMAGLPAADHGLILAIIPPWEDSAAIIRAAGGTVVGPTTAPFAAFAFSDQAGFADALRDNGAVLAFDAQRFAAFCGV